MNILDQLADYARVRVAGDMARVPLEKMRQAALASGEAQGTDFEKALRRPGISLICEIKRASPSKGMISEKFPYLEIAGDYTAAGADCISCLTEPRWFLGSDQIFEEIRQATPLPMLRKDFTVSEYQIYQAKTMGANAVLLICAILDTGTLAGYLELCGRLGLSALVEAHDAGEIASAVSAGAKIIGVNNRNLKDFSVDTGNTKKLRSLVPKDVIFVAESGVKDAADVSVLAETGVDAILIGEALMRAEDKAPKLAELKSRL